MTQRGEGGGHFGAQAELFAPAATHEYPRRKGYGPLARRCDHMRHARLVFLGLVLLAGCAGAFLQQSNRATFPKAVVPLGFTGHEARYPVVSVHIQGRAYRLLLDTGAEGAALGLTPEALATIDARFTGRTRAYRNAYGECYRSKEFVVPRISLGDLQIREVVAIETHDSVYGLDGIVGLELLRQFSVLIDYNMRRLVFYACGHTPASLPQERWFKYNYARELRIGVEFGFLDGRHELGLDTGCGCSLVPIDSDLGGAIRSEVGPGVWEIIHDEGAGREYVSCYVDHVYLDTYDLGGTRLVLGDLPPYMNDGVIGFELFKNNLVYINFWKREIWLKRARQDCSPGGWVWVSGVAGSRQRAVQPKSYTCAGPWKSLLHEAPSPFRPGAQLR